MIFTKAALAALFIQCSPQVAPVTLATIIDVESGGNPNVIAIVDNNKSIYAEDKDTAIKLASTLDKEGKNYSVGLMQINRKNFEKYGLNNKSALDPCKNIEVGGKIYEQCYLDAKNDPEHFPDEQSAIRGGLSCYYSGNLSRGFVKEGKSNTSYIDRANNAVNKIYNVPAIKPENPKYDVTAKDDITGKSNAENKPQKQPWDIYGDFNL
ncbi:lytic transglycosylase domain-containing protein [Salmonella enterica]